MVQNSNGEEMKEKLYTLIAHAGINFMQKFFPEYFAVEPLRPTDRYIEYPFILENLPQNKDNKILDIGCTGSMFPLLLQSLGYITYGIDIRDYPLKDKFNFTKGDICHTKFPDDYFDIITAISIIEHIGIGGRWGVNGNGWDDLCAIQEIHRILKPNGMFLMTVPFGKEYKIEKNHRIYDVNTLTFLLKYFTFTMVTLNSPEADYDIALIKAVK